MTSPTTAEVLEAAADLLSKPGAWTQGALGRKEDGSPICDPAELSTASCYCMAGALWVANGLAGPWSAFDALLEGPRNNTGSWNDDRSRTQAEVVEALRAAAKQARTQPDPQP